MKKRILVKFCGHCNPRLSMKKVLGELEILHPDYEYTFYKEEMGGALCLVLCGCPAMCASHSFKGDELRVHPNIGESSGEMAARTLELMQV